MTPVDNPTTLLEWALTYAELGWHIFPVWGIKLKGVCACPLGRECKRKGKHPITTSGFADASDDPDVIEGWWNDYPDANIGLWTGKSEVVAIDLDPAPGLELEELRWRLQEQFGPDVTEALTCSTGGGGQHLYFDSESAKYGPSASQVMAGVDVRAGGSYTILPPSVHESGREYEWDGDDPRETRPGPAPEPLKAVLAAGKAARAQADERVARGSSGAPEWVEELIEKGSPMGRQHHDLVRYAGYLVQRRLPEETMLAALTDLVEGWEQDTRHPWTEDDLREILVSAREWGGQGIQATLANGTFKKKLKHLVGRAPLLAPQTSPDDQGGEEEPEPADGAWEWREPPEESDEELPLSRQGRRLSLVRDSDVVRRRWLLPDLISEGGVFCLFGEPGSGKTYVALYWVLLYVRSGGTVAYIDAEGDREVMLDRLERMGATEEELNRIIYFAIQGLDLDRVSEFGHYIASQGVSMVVFDTLSDQLSVNGLKEDVGDDVTAFFRAVAYPLRYNSVASLWVDHIPKNAAGDIRGPVGSRVKNAKFTASWQVVVEVPWFAGSGQGQCKVYPKKMNKDMAATMTERLYVMTPTAPGIFPQSVMVSDGSGLPGMRQAAVNVRAPKVFLRIVDAGEAGVSRAVIQRETGLSDAQWEDVIKHLQDQGKVKKIGSGRAIKYVEDVGD